MRSLISLFLICIAAVPVAQARCDLPAGKMIASTRQGRTVVWTLPLTDALHAPFADFHGAVGLHLRWVSSHGDWSARAILERHLEVGRGILDRLMPGDRGRERFERGIRNVEGILAGRTGRVRAMNCLESIPFREMLKVVDLRSRQAEFQASILTKGGSVQVIGDFYLPKGGFVGTGESRAAASLRKRLQKEGWQLASHFHNHPFQFRGPKDDVGGTPAPSDADVAAYRSYRPHTALITNGIHTIELTEDDWRRLE